MSIQIRLVNGVLTNDTQTFSNMDPYCVLKLGQQSFRSKTKQQAGKRPTWNETFTFNAQDNLLKISVLDEDTANDDLIGEATLDISKYRNNPNEQQQLIQLFYQGKSAGKIQLVLRGQGGNIQNNFGQGNPYMQQNQWGNTNQNNGLGNNGSQNQFNQPNPNSPFGTMGQYLGQQAGNNGQQGLQNNYQAQYQMINGFGMNNPNPGYNPNNPNPGYNPNNPFQ